MILPTYNRRYCLARSITSVLSQTCSDYELLIIDDGSTDDTVAWLQQTYPAATYPHIKVIALAQNQGPSSARNVGIRAAQADWLAFLDSDDQWQPEFLERHWQAISKQENVALSACDVLAIQHRNPDEKVLAESKVWSIYADATEHMLMSSLIWSMSLVVANRHYVLQAGLLNEQLTMCEDRELYLRLLYYGTYVHVPEALVIKIQETDSLTRNMERYAQAVIQAIDCFLDSPEGVAYRHLRQVAKSRWSLNLARTCFEQNTHYMLAARLIIRAIYHDPSLVLGAIKRRLPKA